MQSRGPRYKIEALERRLLLSAALFEGPQNPVGIAPNSVAMSDLNGDGNPDIVTANSFSGNVSVLLGNGDGTFQKQQLFSVGNPQPMSVALADVNGDGRPDIVTANIVGPPRTFVSILLGNGDGTFQTRRTFGGSSNLKYVAVADVNKDNNLDIVTTSAYTNNVSVYLGNGDGTFQTQFTLAFDFIASCLTVADVNGDDNPDIVTATTDSNSPNTVSVLLGNGDGSFQTAQTFVVGDQPSSVAVADVDRDGKLDILTANSASNTASVLLGNGDGTFQNQQIFNVGNNPGSVALSDVNGDGTPDIVTANGGSNTVSVLLGNGDCTFQNQQTFSVGSNPSSVALSDVNGDGKPDIATANGGSNNVSVLLGNGDGSFRKTQTRQTIFGFGSNLGLVALSDVNGDGKPDILTKNGSNIGSVLLGMGDGTFQTPLTFAGLAGSFAVADLNGDGKPDIVTAGNDSTSSNTFGVLLGNGDGTFQVPQTVINGSGTLLSMAVVDLNGDRKPDLVTATLDDTLGVLLGNGDGTFQTAQTFAVGGDYPWFIAVADLNGDDKQDIVTANNQSRNLSVLLGNGDGTFQTPQSFAVGSGNAPQSVAVADFNADGSPDIVTTNGAIVVLFGNGDGTFRTAQTLASGTVVAFTIADVNGDGKPDIVTENASNIGTVLLGMGDGTFQTPLTFAGLAGSFAVADLNGDGKPDIVMVTRSFITRIVSSSVIVLLNMTTAPVVNLSPSVAEILARGVAYDNWSDGTDVGAKYPGLDYKVFHVLDDNHGFYAIELTSATNGPALVIRGTEPWTLFDWWANSDQRGAGYSQFRGNWNAISSWLGGKTVDIVGHSLGGAIAQYVASAWTAAGHTIDKLFTFNSPGIDTASASAFKGSPADVTHYEVNGDIVSMAGSSFIPGTVEMASYSDVLYLDFGKHTRPLLNSTIGSSTKPTGITWQTYPSVDVLEDPAYYPSDPDYRRWVLALQIVGLATFGPTKLGLAPAELRRRDTVEGSRHAIGQLLRDVKGAAEWTAQTATRYYLTITGMANTLYQALTPSIDDGFSLTLDNGDPAGLKFGGNLGLNIGSNVTISLPPWLGGTISADHLAELVNMDTGGVIDRSGVTVNGDLSLLGGLATINGTASVNWQQGNLGVTGATSILGGFITGSAAASIGKGLDLSFGGTGTVTMPTIPVWGLSWLSGKSLTGGHFLFKYTNNGTLSDDFVAGWGSLGPLQVGLRVFFDGSFGLLGAKEISALTPLSLNSMLAPISVHASKRRPSRASAAAQVASAAMQVGQSFDVAAGTTWALFRIDWQNDSNSAAITLTAPSGLTLDEAAIAADPSMMFVTELTGTKGKAVYVTNPAAGTWTVTMVDSTELGTVNIAALVNVSPISVGFTSMSGGSLRDPVNVQLAVTDPTGQAKVALFYDTDGAGTDGVMITDGLQATSGQINYAWQTAGVAAGSYYIYAVIYDQNNAPSTSYSSGTVSITDARPTVQSKTFDFANTAQSTRVQFSTDVSASIDLGDFVLTNLTQGVAIPTGNLAETYDQYTNTAILTAPGVITNGVAGLLPDGNYRLQILAGGISNSQGTAMGSDQTFDFFVLGGDANHDRTVDIQDLYALASNWQGDGRIFDQGDFNYDGKVDAADLGILASHWQATLPLPAPAVPISAVRAPARRTPFRVVTLID